MLLADLLEAIVDLGYVHSTPLGTSILEARRLGASHRFPSTTLTVDRCKRVTSALLDGSVSASDGQAWARFLLGRREVVLDEDFDDLLLSFLEDWSFSATEALTDRTSLATWQARFDLGV